MSEGQYATPDAQGQPQVPSTFTSLTELRAKHIALMREVRDQESDEDQVRRVHDFIDQAQAVGRWLDSPADRESAQNILAYWASHLFSAGDQRALSASLPVLDPFDQSHAKDLSKAANPYEGLRPFSEDEADHFFGREDEVRTIIDKLRDQPMIFISGPAGSGKTSIVAAGIVPRLKLRLIAKDRNPVVLVVRPGADPFAALLRSVHDAVEDPSLPGLETWIAEQKTQLERAPAQLRVLLDATFPGRPVILVVDDFEQFLATCPDAKTREQFVEALASACSDPQSPDRTIIIVDEQHESATFQLAAFAPLAGNPAARFVLPPLTAAEARRIIEGGAAAIGLRYDEGIIEDLATDVAGDGRAPPTLQFTLGRLWNEREGNRITWDAYRKVGKPREALKRTADVIFESLSSDEQPIAQKLFLELVQPASGGTFICRRVRRDALAQIGPRDMVARVVARYVEAGLIRQTAGVEWDDDRFDVPHDALATYWLRLRDWLQRERTDSKKKLQFIAMARRWQEAGFENDYLLRGTVLEEAAAYAAAAPDLGLLVAKSREEGRRAQRRAFLKTAVVSTIAALLIVAVWKWIVAARETEKARELASGAVGAVSDLMRVVDNVDEGGGVLPVQTTHKQLEIAQKILRSLGERPDQEITPVRIDLLTQLSDFARWTGNRAQALRYATTAEVNAHEYLKENAEAEEGERLLYESEWRVGDLLDNDRTKAKSKYDHALQIARKWASKKPDDDVWHQELALTEYRMGDAVRKQDPDQSLQWYEDGLTVSQKGWKAKPANRRWRRLAGFGHLHIAETYVQQDHLEQALAEYQTMLRINNALLDDDSQNRFYQYYIAGDYLDLGNLYKSKGDFEEALTQYNKGLDLVGELVKYDPDAPDWQDIGAVLHGLVAEIKIHQQRFDEALKEYGNAAQIRDLLAQMLPDDAGRQRDLAIAHLHNGDAYKERGESQKDHGDLREAADAYKRGMEVIDKFKLRDPANASSLEQTRDELQAKIQSLPSDLR